MVGIEGLGLSPVRANNGGNASATSSPTAKTGPASSDSLALSPLAQEASQAVSLAQQMDFEESRIRQERVAQAKQSIEEGTHRMQEVVRFVAARLTRYLAE